MVDSLSLDLSAAMLIDVHAGRSSRKSTTPEFEHAMALDTIMKYLREKKTYFEARKHYRSIWEMTISEVRCAKRLQYWIRQQVDRTSSYCAR